MPVNIKKIPPAAERPETPRLERWFGLLALFFISGTAIGLYLDKQTEGTRFWLLIPAALVFAWLAVFALRLLVWAALDLRANGWDRAREEVLLREMRRGRRALQVLHADLSIPVPPDLIRSATSQLMQGDELLVNQHSRTGNQAGRHACFQVTADMELYGHTGSEALIRSRLIGLMKALAVKLAAFPSEQPVNILMPVSTSVAQDTLQALWQEAVKVVGIRQQLVPVEGSGQAFIDHWLDTRFQENTLLLIVAFQVEPEDITDTGEAFVSLLLGNRLTQQTLPPLALLHRPERTTPATAAEDIRQAADWVPVEDGEIRHLWASGLTDAQENAVQIAAHSPVLAGVDFTTSRYVTDDIIGNTGAATPWLALAAAAQASRKTRMPQMVITADPDGESFWSQVISPL